MRKRASLRLPPTVGITDVLRMAVGLRPSKMFYYSQMQQVQTKAMHDLVKDIIDTSERMRPRTGERALTALALLGTGALLHKYYPTAKKYINRLRNTSDIKGLTKKDVGAITKSVTAGSTTPTSVVLQGNTDTTIGGTD